MGIDEILADFDYLDDWEDRYRYVIELGKKLAPLDDADRNSATKVEGCVSQVWLKTRLENTGEEKTLYFTGDSDAHIVRGLIAILFAIYSGKTAAAIQATDAESILAQLGLSDHLTQQRSNGLKAMVQRIKAEAATALAA